MSPMQRPNDGRVYTIRRAVTPPGLTGDWSGEAWRRAEVAEVSHFRPEGSGHEPRTEAKVLYDEASLYLIFRVEDRYVLCTHTEYQARVCNDACVEFFVEPKPDKGYFNFEMNGGGHLLLYYIEDPTREGDVFKKRTAVPWDLAQGIRVYHSLPERIPAEITEPTTWIVEYSVPMSLFETFTGPIGDPAEQTWRGNFYKCAEACSHPHWASWAPIGPELNFHVPDYFGRLLFPGS